MRQSVLRQVSLRCVWVFSQMFCFVIQARISCYQLSSSKMGTGSLLFSQLIHSRTNRFDFISVRYSHVISGLFHLKMWGRGSRKLKCGGGGYEMDIKHSQSVCREIKMWGRGWSRKLKYGGSKI